MADTTNRLSGTAYFTIDGVNYALVGECSYNPSVVERETESGMDGVHGYSEKPRPGMIAAKIRDAGGLTVADFNAMTNVQINVELANGKNVIGRNMWSVESQEVETEKGTFAVKFEGFSVTEA